MMNQDETVKAAQSRQIFASAMLEDAMKEPGKFFTVREQTADRTALGFTFDRKGFVFSTSDGWEDGILTYEQAVDRLSGELGAKDGLDQDQRLPLYTPAMLQEDLIRTYKDLQASRLALYMANYKLDLAKRALANQEFLIRATAGYLEIKGAVAQADFVKAKTGDWIRQRDAAEATVDMIRLEFDQHESDVALTRALLRVAELANGIRRAE